MLRITGGRYRNRQLRTPKGKNTRPTAGSFREALFNICRSFIDDADVLDLFAGSGAVGLEALSRGARSVVFCDKDRMALRCLRENVETLGVKDAVEVCPGDANKLVRYLAQSDRQFDLIYIDPPYRFQVDALLQLIAEEGLLATEGVLFVERGKGEASPSEEIPPWTLIKIRDMGSSVLYQYEAKR